MQDQSYTVDEFAEAEGICRSMVYKMWKQGNGRATTWSALSDAFPIKLELIGSASRKPPPPSRLRDGEACQNHPRR